MLTHHPAATMRHTASNAREKPLEEEKNRGGAGGETALLGHVEEAGEGRSTPQENKVSGFGKSVSQRTGRCDPMLEGQPEMRTRHRAANAHGGAL